MTDPHSTHFIHLVAGVLPLVRSGQDPRAAELLSRALELLTRRLLVAVPGPGKFLALVAEFEARHGRPRRAARLSRWASWRLRRDGMACHRDLAPDLDALAEALEAFGDGWITGLGLVPGDLLLVQGYRHVAMRHIRRGHPGQAEPFLRRALEIFHERGSADHPELASLCLDLAESSRVLGRHGEAEEALRRALGIYHGLVSASHPGLLPASRQLATLYLEIEDWAAAEPVLVGIREIHRHCLGTAHPGFAHSQSELAALFVRMDKKAEAEALYYEIVQTLRRPPASRRRLALLFLALAHLHRLQERPMTAEAAFHRAWKTAVAALDKNHVSAVRIANDLGTLYHEHGRLRAARALYEHAAGVLRQSSGKSLVLLDGCLRNLALLRHHAGEMPGASPSRIPPFLPAGTGIVYDTRWPRFVAEEASMPFNVFISYSRNNTAERAALVSALEKIDNLEIFYDKQSILVTESIHETISSFLHKCDTMIALLTRQGLESKEVADELSRAHVLEKTIIPIVAQDVKWEDLPWFLRDTHCVVYSQRNFDEAVRAVSELVASKAAIVGATAKRRPANANTTQRSFARSDSAEFIDCVESLLPGVRRLVLIGTGLNILQRDPFLIDVTNRAARGDCDLEIFLADPTSPAVETRLIEEELGILKPPVARAGLKARLKTLMKLVEQHQCPATIHIGLFRHYPTFALLILDDDYFVYPYGYATLGNLSPVIRFSKEVAADRDVIEFLEEQYRLVKSTAIDARSALALRGRSAAKADNLHAFALYIVPHEDSDLYNFGTQVLGYDVRREKMDTSPWPDYVDAARDFGFHLTLCDVLYFLNESELAQAEAEVEFLAEEFKSFRLTNLQLRYAFPDDHSAAIVPEDPTGSLEALHHELVHRVYRRAAASNYTLGLDGRERSKASKRRRLMLERYRAPYVLNRYQPHFTLMTNVAPDRWASVQKPLEKLFADTVRDPSIRIQELAVMSRCAPDVPWTIRREIDLE